MSTPLLQVRDLKVHFQPPRRGFGKLLPDSTVDESVSKWKLDALWTRWRIWVRKVDYARPI